MSKLSAVMVRVQVPLRQLPESDRLVLRRVFTECVVGANEKHHKRLMRWLRSLTFAAPGETKSFYPDVDRSRKFHARWMAIEQRFFDNQDAFVHQDRFRDWIKRGAGWGEYERVGERLLFVPGSISYEAASDDEMRDFAEAATDFLRSPRAGRKLWPHLPAPRRAEMVETLLRDPSKQEDAS